MGTATAKRREIEVVVTVANTVLQMTAVCLHSPERPGRRRGIGEEPAEFAAMTTRAGDLAGSYPITGRRQGLGDAGAQMSEASGSQTCDGNRLGSCRFTERKDRRDKDGVWVSGAPPSGLASRTGFDFDHGLR